MNVVILLTWLFLGLNIFFLKTISDIESLQNMIVKITSNFNNKGSYHLMNQKLPFYKTNPLWETV